MLAIAGALALLMLMLAVIQSVIRQDIWILARAAFGYLPMAFILAGRDRRHRPARRDHRRHVRRRRREPRNRAVRQPPPGGRRRLQERARRGLGHPAIRRFLGAIILALGAFVLWLEMIIRDAAIYICVFFLPLTFVAMVWPATSRWARRLVELLVAIILAKFVIISILTLATAAIANTGVAGDTTTFEQMLAGSAILVLAAWSPFALLRMIPMMELAARRRPPTVGRAERSRIGRRAQPRRLHASGDGPALAVNVRQQRRETGSDYISPRVQGSSSAGRRGVAAFRLRRRRRPGRRRGERTGPRANRIPRAFLRPFDGRTPRADGSARPVAPQRPRRIRAAAARASPPRRDRLNRRSTDARLPNRRLIDARRRSRRPTGVHRSTEVKRERRRVSALPLAARAAGLIGSLRPVQVIVIAFQSHAGVILMRVLSSGAGVVAALALALVAVAFCFWPVGGRSADAWLPVIARHATAGARQTRPAVTGPQRRSTAHGGRTAGADRLAPRSVETSNCSRHRSTASRSGC